MRAPDNGNIMIVNNYDNDNNNDNNYMNNKCPNCSQYKEWV